ncbi:MAG: mycothiol synthase [Kineosporiaceae bacterium]
MPDAQPSPRIRTLHALETEVSRAVLGLVEAATDADGVSPLSEHVTLHVRAGGDGRDVHLLAESADGEVVGYAHLDPTDPVAGSAVELVVHPGHRGSGTGRALVAAAEAASPDDRVRLWAHGDQPAARHLAKRLGYHEVRRLVQMRRSLWAPLPTSAPVAGVRLRAFRPGEDDRAWLDLNSRAFAHHPEQGRWTLEDLRARQEESWFDPRGFLLAHTDDALVGFVWTKVHGRSTEPGDAHAHEPIGEIYVVGADPSAQGRGLGRLLTVAGLHWLRSRGLAQAMLYVDADNEPAVALYRRLGFSEWDADVMFRRGS